MTEPLLSVRDLDAHFATGPVAVSRPCASVSFRHRQGETLALVGESGSGKSVTALSILQLLPYPMASPSVRLRSSSRARS